MAASTAADSGAGRGIRGTAAAISDSSDLTIEKINEKTLRDIALNYGGANNVEGGGVLLLNKKDLIAFGDVRGTNEKKAVYEIELSENSTTTGTIKDGGLAVKFCIVDELPAISEFTVFACETGDWRITKEVETEAEAIEWIKAQFVQTAIEAPPNESGEET